MNWDLYRVFLRLAESGSIIQAARALHVSEPTVSRKLDALESYMKVPLFYRGVTGVKLTREGETLYRDIARIEDVLEGASTKLTADTGTLKHRVSISTTPGMTQFWLSGILPQFAQQNPSVQFDIHSSYKQIDLIETEIDIVIRIGSPINDDLVGVNVGQIAFGFYATREFAETHDLRALSPKVFARVPVVMPPVDYANARKTSSVFDAYLSQDDVNNQMITDEIQLQRKAVELGTHCACMPVAFCDDLAAARLPIDGQPHTVFSDLWLLRTRESKQRAAVTTTFEFLKEALTAARPYFLAE